MALTAQDLQRIGFNDPNVIAGILNDPGQVARYERELGLGGTSGGASSAEESIKLITGQLQELLESFDSEAARRVAEEKLGPEYDQLLQDYLTEVTLGKERSVEDLASGLGLLGARRESYLGEIERESPRRQEAIGGRFEARGLYGGGERMEEQRRQLEKEAVARGDYDREYEYKTEQAQLSQERYVADVERKIKQRERELAQEREKAVTGLFETQREEHLRGY